MEKIEGVKTYDLNISENYVPKWGAWEVGREIISNAIDADKLGYKVEIVERDHIRVTTKSRPTLAQIKFIGGGTKSEASGTIGCFGEGIKLAAMVATRLGGAMVIRFENYRVEYELTHDVDLGARSAIMRVTSTEDYFDGMAVDLVLENIAHEVSGRFLDSLEAAMLPKRYEDKMIIYNKGVFVAEKTQRSIFDWNLSTGINRDRNVIDFWNIGHQIAVFLDANIDTKIARKLLDSSRDTFEVECVTKHAWATGQRMAHALLDALKEKEGADIVIATDDADANQIARRCGKRVILIDDEFRKIIQSIPPGERVPMADEVVTHRERLNIDSTKEYDLTDVKKVMDALDIFAEVFVFESAGPQLGLADFSMKRKRVYLSSKLFEAGQRTQRLATLCHELAHINAKASDGSITFEDELSRIAGVLARQLIEK